MQMEEIYQLIDKFEKSTLSGLEIETEEIMVKLKREMTTNAAINVQTPVMGQMEVPVGVVEKTPQGTPVEAGITFVKAPLVGTFYRASSPDAKPYVMSGQKVKKGEVLGLIEAMKLMNEVLSPVDGVVLDILGGNEELVQYDEVLFKIKESGV